MWPIQGSLLLSTELIMKELMVKEAQQNLEIQKVLKRIKELRIKQGVSIGALEKRLILGPGWVSEFEDGKTIPGIDIFFAIIQELGLTLGEFKIENLGTVKPVRELMAEVKGDDLVIKFPYGKHNADFELKSAQLPEFEEILLVMRNGLSGLGPSNEQLKASVVADTFIKATKLWPHINPSDIWWFVVYRAFLDPFNHPASEARLNFAQSWKRTAGWALEKVLVEHYSKDLSKVGVRVYIGDDPTKRTLLAQVKSISRIEADKVDVLLTTAHEGKETLFGVVHVKASFAERRTDDVPLSKDLISAGYFSPMWTMDCKSLPARYPKNKGELGSVREGAEDRRSAKRKDIEDDGYFSGCYSYNANTKETPSTQKSKANILTLDFSNPRDKFYEDVINARDNFLKSK